MSTAIRWLGLWGPVLAFVLLVFFLSSQSSVPGIERLWDKFLHTAAYGVFGVLCLRACHGGMRRLRPRQTALAMLITVGYGAIDEIHQAYVPGRFSSVLDWIADAIGAGLSIPATAWFARLRVRSGRTVR